MTSFPCPHCQSWVSVAEIEIGKPVPCPHCQADVYVPDVLPPVRVPPTAAVADAEPQAAEPAEPTVQENLQTVTWMDAPTAPPSLEGPDAAVEAAGPAAKDPGLAAALSVFPGAGHWYCGRFGRGLAYLFFQVAIIAMTFVAWQNVQHEKGYFGKYGLLIIGICSFIAIGLLCMYDASRCARQRNRMFLLE